MIKSFLISICLAILPALSFGQARCELELAEGYLTGTCTNSYFSAFQIPYEANLVDSAAFFSSLPIEGQTIIKDQYKLPATYTITIRAGYPQALIKCNPGWFTMDSIEWKGNSMSFYIDHDPEVPVTRDDLKIIQRVKELLATSDTWHKEDDRDCNDDFTKGKFSLFCALQKASIEVEGSYNHRNAVMQKVRHEIEVLYPDRKWEHRLRDFNNMPETTFDTITNVLEKIEMAIQDELLRK